MQRVARNLVITLGRRGQMINLPIRPPACQPVASHKLISVGLNQSRVNSSRLFAAP